MSQNGDLYIEMEEQVRDKMKRYWQVYEPSIESMMLSNDAQYLTENDQNELLSYLPSFRGMKILELGAGIGRFTSKFAQIADHVTAVDFMESYIKENEERNGHFENVVFQCADATQIEYSSGVFDMVFSNWLLMYLVDSEVERIMERILRWLKPGGFFFFRESCYHQSGNVFRKENPTQYRSPLNYLTMLQKVSTDKTKFQLKTVKNVLTYIHYHGNPNQLCLLAQKENRQPSQLQMTNGNDENHLSPCSGKGRPSMSPLTDLPAGEFMLKNLSTRLGLRPGQRVINFNCGEGAIPTFFVQNFDVYVHGVDCSPVNIHKAIEAQGKQELIHRKKLQYESTNWIQESFHHGTYEAVLGFDFLLVKDEIIEFIKKAQVCLKDSGKMALLILVKSENNFAFDTEDLLSERKLKEHLSASSLTLEEMKPESELAQTYLSHLCYELKKATKDTERDSPHDKLIAQITKKIELLQERCIKLMCVIARK